MEDSDDLVDDLIDLVDEDDFEVLADDEDDLVVEVQVESGRF